MKVVVDAFGGDNAPVEIVEGAVLAVKNNKNLEVILCGKEDKIKEILRGRTERIEIVDASDVITNDDAPTEAIRHKPNSSCQARHFLWRIPAAERQRFTAEVWGTASG